MNPKQVSQRLLQIAAKISNSKNPRKDLVAADLKQVVRRIATGSDSSFVQELMDSLESNGIQNVDLYENGDKDNVVYSDGYFLFNSDQSVDAFDTYGDTSVKCHDIEECLQAAKILVHFNGEWPKNGADAVYVQWEGRSYTPESLKKDFTVVQKLLGKGPYYYAFVDIGVVFSKDPNPVLVQVTRHGDSSIYLGNIEEDAGGPINWNGPNSIEEFKTELKKRTGE